MKKFVAVLIAVLLLVSALPVFATGYGPAEPGMPEETKNAYRPKPVDAKLVLGLYPSANFEANVLDSANKAMPFTIRTHVADMVINAEPDPAGDGICKVIVTRQMAIDMYGKSISIMELCFAFPDAKHIFGFELFTYPLFTALVSDPSYDCIEIIMNPAAGEKALSSNLYTADGVIPVDLSTAANIYILEGPFE